MEESISKTLNLPIFNGTLIAFVVFDRWEAQKDFEKDYPQHKGKFDFQINNLKEFKEFCLNNLKRYYSVDWKLQFLFQGPNARYNSGLAEIPSKKFNEFIENLEISVEKMKILSKNSFSGTYSKNIGNLRNPSIEICADDGNVLLKFWVHSETYKFPRELSINNTEDLINELKQLPEKALKVMTDLEKLSF